MPPPLARRCAIAAPVNPRPSQTAAAPILVGREREQMILREHLAETHAAHGGLVLIGGEAGIGKTVLAEAILREAAQQGALVLAGRCYDLTETPPYGPWVELFGRFQQGDGMPPLPAAFGQRGTIGPVASTAALFQDVAAFLAAVANQQPQVLLLDDLHWADPASLDLLRFVTRDLSNHPLLVLAVYRTDELTRPHPLYHLLPLLVREAHAARLDLHALNDDAVLALVTAHYPLTDADTRRLVTYVQGCAQGNPFYLSELLRSLEETGVLRREGARWTLGNLTHTAVPPLLRQVIDSRLAHLDAECQRLLALAAVIGHEVPLAVWMTVSDADEQTLLTAIEQGAKARLLTELPGGTRVQFGHALVREALYEGVAPTQRRRLHRRMGEALLVERDPDPDAVAYHFQRAGDERAAEWLMRAALRAYRADAWETAVARDQAALALLEEQGADVRERAIVQYSIALMRRYTAPRESIALFEAAERLAVVVSDRALVYGARVIRGALRCLLGDIAQGLPEMIAAVELQESLTPAERVPHQMRGFWSVQMAPNAHGSVLLWLATAGRYREAVAMRERFFAHTAPKPVLRGSSGHGNGLLGLANAYLALGRVGEARDALRQAQELFAEAGDHKSLAEAAATELRLILAFAADHLAGRRQVAAEAEEALERASGVVGDIPTALLSAPLLLVEGRWSDARALTEQTESLAVPIFFSHTDVSAALAYLQGDTIHAWESVRAMLPDGSATEPGTRRFSDALSAQRLAVHLSLDAGDLAQARAWLDAHRAWVDWSGTLLGLSEGDALWAQYYRQAGESDTACAHAERALAHASKPRQPLALLAAHRLLGELATDTGRFNEAAAHLYASLALADACAAPFERALTLLASAELHAVTVRHGEARSILEQVRTLCTTLGATPALMRADALAARLAEAETRPPIYPANLSEREVAVLRLLAAGRTNREIAATLFLSAYTVRNHVTHILAKTGTQHRAAAAAFAVRHGLI